MVTAPAMAGTAGAPSDGVVPVEAKKGQWHWAHSRYWFVDGVSMGAARVSCRAWGRYGVQKDVVARHWETRDQARFGIERA
ncbi:hypothetical protein [Amycolatopsis sp. cmx-4-54]|uniref:hypothetical protein n=1 Tax=Amycolatopsis sp. cmx-4-54 TaxID=2790936 RepID=UPI00397B29A4